MSCRLLQKKERLFEMSRSRALFFTLFILLFIFIVIFFYFFFTRHPVSISKEMDWAIAIYQGESPFDLAPAPGVKNPVIRACDVSDVKAEYVADPFMVSFAGQWYMFFEVMNALTNQGDVGYATSQDGLSWEYKKIVLDEPFHLSYPYVFYWDGHFYMIPESAKGGAIRLYRADNFPESWSFIGNLIAGEFADNSVFYEKDTWWILTCSKPHSHDELRLFFADNLMGPWTEHPASPIVQGDATKAQPGGRVLVSDDRIIRFAHYDKKTYGKKVLAFFITELSRTEYSERAYENNPVLKGGPKGWNRHGMHHIDAHEIAPGKWIAAVDGYRKHLTIKIEY